MNHRLRWPEALAITVLLLLGVLLASGSTALPPLLP
ncbi:hypothetical protein Aros01_05906 [Streptosporangium roseum]|uniref:Uncharacterized protein n=1 Tax=Streptosporangium roseum (strain ATCC 12428 / DSM 43021 / JCM 3005 / KCTC 9067 / NCIMB 10171 / NRRL 2505 / NI 9100) TaxID=479432 RepID=D2B233_STRRD|nr:hypothetical protein Sros_6544 [Streptosporangium roseum DSM 43021]